MANLSTDFPFSDIFGASGQNSFFFSLPASSFFLIFSAGHHLPETPPPPYFIVSVIYDWPFVMSDVISLLTKESDHLLTVSGKFVFNGKLTQGVCSLLSIN